MPIPETTSAEAFEQYIAGTCTRRGRGRAWKEVKAWIFEPPRDMEGLPLPSVSEPFIAWTMSGEAEFQEREGNGAWIDYRIHRGSFFLTTGGSPYECRWKMLSPEPFVVLLVLLDLQLLHNALEEVLGAKALQARLRDISAFTDDVLGAQMELLRGELMRSHASPLLVRGLGQAIAVHLARTYAVVGGEARSQSPSLPGYKLRQVTDWMAEHLAEEVNLDRLAERARLSKFHFHRLFKAATGLSPSRYHLNLRMDTARRLLRETEKSVITVALDVGYSNPSHFAQLFRRETGLSPSDYRRRR